MSWFEDARHEATLWSVWDDLVAAQPRPVPQEPAGLVASKDGCAVFACVGVRRVQLDVEADTNLGPHSACMGTRTSSAVSGTDKAVSLATS
jgi:hypothetical protein